MGDADTSAAPRSRPVADAPVAAFADGSTLAKAWLLELIASAPLEAADRIVTADFVREAPGLCRAIGDSLVDDGQLLGFARGGPHAARAARVGALTGARGSVEVAAAVEALRRSAWRALRADLGAAPAGLVADLAERLSEIVAALTAAALGAPGSVERGHDDLVGEISMRDTRGRPASWPSLLEHRLQRFARDALPFVLMLVEVDDAQNLAATDRPEEVVSALADANAAISAVPGLGGELAGDGTGRNWCLPEIPDEAGARRLAGEIAAAVGEAAKLREVGLTVSIGIAVCPGDGIDVQALEGCAEERMFCARAAGVPVSQRQ